MDFDVQLESVANAVWAEKQAAVNIGSRVPLFEYFRKPGNVKEWDGVGRTINEPVLAKYTKNKVQGLARFQELKLQPEDGALVIPFTPKNIANTMALDNNDLEAASGEAKMIDLVATSRTQAEIEMADCFEEWFVSDGTAQDGKVFLGLDALIPADPTTGTICGYNRATTTWIRTNSVSGAKTTTAYDNLKAKLENIYNTCTRGSIKPDLIPTSQTILEVVKTLYEDKHMYQNEKDAYFGFEGVKFRNALIVFLDVITTADMWVLSKDAIHFRAKMTNGSPFRTTPWCNQEKITKALVTTAAMIFRGALTMSRPRCLGRIHSIS